MLNKKGFTIAEVLVSFSLIAVVLTSIISATLFYRDRLKQEEIVSQLNDFKNTVTKVVYDDIVDNNIVSVERCINISNCVNFIDSNNNTHVLKIVEFNNNTETNKRGVYLYYNNIKYMLPDSDLGTGSDRYCDFVGGIDVDEYDGKLYKVKATFKHREIDLRYDLLFVVS